MDWSLAMLLAVGCYGFKAGGVLASKKIKLSEERERLLNYVAPAVLSGLIITQTFENEGQLYVGAPAAGLVAGALAAYLKAPFPLVLAIAAAATALVRLL